MMPERYYHPQGVEPRESCAVWVFCHVPMCPYLIGRFWDELALSAVLAMRPDSLRVIRHGDPASDDARRYRLSVHLDEQGKIKSVTQELPVPCPELIKNATHWKELLGISI